MLLKIAAIAALCTTGVVAQTIRTAPNCMTSGGVSFAFCTTALDVNLFWNYSAQQVDFVFEGPADGYRAVGFSSAMASMIPSNVVFGCIEMGLTLDAAGVDFALTARNPAGVAQAGNQNLMNYNQTIVNNMCTVQFTRPVDIAIPEQTLNDRDQSVIVARGGPVIAPHDPSPDRRMAFTVNFANPAAGADGPGGAASALSASMTLVPMIVGSILVALW